MTVQVYSNSKMLTDPKFRVSFLGPRGTFCEQAALSLVGSSSVLIEATTVEKALDMVRCSQVDQAVVPIENSVEGGVNATLDSLASGQGLTIVSEAVIPIRFSLVCAADSELEASDLAKVTRIGTHPHAWAQCRQWVSRHMEGYTHIPTTSTAQAVSLLCEDNFDAFEVALCASSSVQVYPVRVLAQDIADNPSAQTRFVLVGRPGHIPAATGADKTTVQVTLPSNESGALLNMLEQFSARGVNLSRIESRPVGGHFNRYAFSIDLEGHIDEERVKAALVGLYRTCPEVRFIGSYPRADGHVNQVLSGTANADFIGAREWIEQISSGKGV